MKIVSSLIVILGFFAVGQTATDPWRFAADEGGTCQITTPKLVRFGADGYYYYQVATSNIPCNTTQFGGGVARRGDPRPNIPKHCDCADTSVGPDSIGWQHTKLNTIVTSTFIPKNYVKGVKVPLILALHAFGDRGDDYVNIGDQDMLIFAHDTTQAKYPCIIYAPQCPLSDRWVNIANWNADFNYSMSNMPPTPAWTDMMKGLDAVIARYSIDTNRIYICGGSMGGYGTWYTLAKYPKRFAAAVPTAGGGDPATAGAFKDIPLWAFHVVDDFVVSVEASRSMITAMRNAGGSPKYTEYTFDQTQVNGYVTYAQHIFYMPIPVESTLLPWVFSQNKGSATSTKRQAISSMHRASSVAKSGLILHMGKSNRMQVVTQEAGSISNRTFDLRGTLISP